MPASLDSFPGEVFTASPDHDALYINECVKQAHAMMLHAIRSRRGIITLIGESGTGKTTLLGHIAFHYQNEASFTFVPNAPETFEELLDVICARCGVPPGPDTRTAIRLERLTEHLLHSLVEDRRVVIFIDDAQLLPVSVLKHLRLLANLETNGEKLLQIVLCGQPELLETLRNPELKRLRERISIWARLEPMSPRDAVEYVTTRFVAAGLERQTYFNDRELRAIGKAAGGVPRTINAICDHALVAAFHAGRLPVDAACAARAIRRVIGGRAPRLAVRGAIDLVSATRHAMRRRLRAMPSRAGLREHLPGPPTRVASLMTAFTCLLILAAAKLEADTGALRRAWGRYLGSSSEASAPARIHRAAGPGSVVLARAEASEFASPPRTTGIFEPPARSAALHTQALRVTNERPAHARGLSQCGDGILDFGEECDDGNDIDSDACLNNCLQAVCGDGVLHADAEQCDDANAKNEDACLIGCALARCGDGYVHAGIEECDDGNDIEDDGCSTRCTREFQIGALKLP